ncbi:MAG: sensor histidine kinase [Opitutae bacterium]|nr:sensor histidine kinase [Opitutae bacterium]
MTPRRFPSRLILAAGLALVIAGLGWLVFVVAGSRTGMQLLPGANGTVGSFIEESPRLGIDDVSRLSRDRWQPWDGRDYLKSPHGGVLWMRVTLRNPSSETQTGVLADSEYFTDWVEAWLPGDAGGANWSHRFAGEARPGAQKAIWSRTAAFLVSVPAGAERVIYLRATDHYYAYLRLHWWPRAEDFFAAQTRELLAEVMCLGGLLALVLYNLALWARLRFPDTGYYVGYAASAGGFNFVSNGGLAWLGLPAGSPAKEMLVVATLATSGVFLVQFTRTFLDSPASAARADRLLVWLRRGLVALLCGVPLMPWMTGLGWLAATILTLTVTHVALLTVALLAWRRGMGQARFFIAAFGLLFLGALPAVVTWLLGDILAGAARGLLAGSLLEMLLLSFAVADRFARLQRERAEAQQRLVEEAEQRRAMQEAYADELRLEVDERTRELQTANADKDRMLTLLGHDLRSPLTAMTQTAEQLRRPGESSSPAQLFAGEVADAGRQMLLLIEDVVLWSRLRVGDTPTRGWHDAGLVVNQAVRLHRAQADRRHVEIALTLTPGHAVQTDLVLAQALLRNLVGNAVKFARTRVTVRVERAGDAMRYTVCDDGPGLPPAVLERLRTGGATGEERGFGLRLCREIAASLGVMIAVGSLPGGGTELGIALPARVASKPPMEVQP